MSKFVGVEPVCVYLCRWHGRQVQTHRQAFGLVIACKESRVFLSFPGSTGESSLDRPIKSDDDSRGGWEMLLNFAILGQPDNNLSYLYDFFGSPGFGLFKGYEINTG